jgi:hypothetical protein
VKFRELGRGLPSIKVSQKTPTFQLGKPLGVKKESKKARKKERKKERQ